MLTVVCLKKFVVIERSCNSIYNQFQYKAFVELGNIDFFGIFVLDQLYRPFELWNGKRCGQNNFIWKKLFLFKEVAIFPIISFKMVFSGIVNLKFFV